MSSQRGRGGRVAFGWRAEASAASQLCWNDSKSDVHILDASKGLRQGCV
jgi:hypothetical protein